MTTPIIVLNRAHIEAGAPVIEQDVAAWEDVCHGQKGNRIVYVNYSKFRDLSRWTHTENKRPFVVSLRDRRGHIDFKLGAASTLAGALKIAARNV